MNFNEFAKAVREKFEGMSNRFVVSEPVKNDIWNRYLDSFPADKNKIYRERREYDCQTCKQFVRNVGNVVSFEEDGRLTTVWDVEADGEFREVARLMHSYVSGMHIKDVFITGETHFGQYYTSEIKDDGSIRQWHHLHADVPNECRVPRDQVATRKGSLKASHDILARSLSEITVASIDIILELIDQRSLYRGDEFGLTLRSFKNILETYSGGQLPATTFAWMYVNSSTARFRNSVIGTLAVDISTGVELERAVASFESKVAPANYQRTNAIVTQSMIDKAIEKIDSLGLEPSLHRRLAKTEDVSINNVLFADRSVSQLMRGSLKSLLMKSVKTPKGKFDKVADIGIEDFVKDVLPNIESMEVMVEPRHNFMTVTAANDSTSKKIFKWDNRFAWSYNGNFTDSVKERVKKAGGDISGDLRVSLSWYNKDDLDIHLIRPGGDIIYYSRKTCKHCKLDVDMNAAGPYVTNAVENISWNSITDIEDGIHIIKVHNFSKRSSDDVGFQIEVEFLGKLFHFSSDVSPRSNEMFTIFKFEVKNGEIKFLDIRSNVRGAPASTTTWDIETGKFHKVNMLMLSPNYWDDNQVGNKHHFFILEGCKTEDKVRGIYNEFLETKLMEHRKVFDLLGDKMMCDPSDEQLSGIGFSNQRNEMLCKVSGNFNRTLNIKF